MKTRCLLSGLALAVSILPLSAQNSGGEGEAPSSENGSGAKQEDVAGLENFWQVTLPGGEYEVALARISSVSRHKYLLDGSLIVDEVTVDTVGQALARFYFIQPVSAGSSATGKAIDKASERGQELLEKVTERAGSEYQDMVVKKYPETTHARTIEYRILSAAQLTSIYNSAKKAWETGKGRKLTVK